MRTKLLLHILLAPSVFAGLSPVDEHVDIRWRWEPPGGWTCQIVTDSNGEILRHPDEVFFVLSDKPYAAANPSNSGARFTQPSSPAFSFTGVPAGQPLWVAVQGTPGIGEAWPGFDNNQSAGTFGSYIPSDLRVSQTTARPWIRISLDHYTPPHGTNASFSLWTTSGSMPRVWMSTHDPSVSNDYFFAEGTHTHLNWGFSKPGIHRVGLKASAFAGPGATNPTGTSTTHTLTFAIGPFARWQASHFDAQAIAIPTISGASADPDRDGMKNLVEFAFGLDPNSGGTLPIEDGLGMPRFTVSEGPGGMLEVLSYPRRRAGSQISPLIYQAQFLDETTGEWSQDGVTTTAEDFSGPLSRLNPEWEWVTSTRSAGVTGQPRGFARVLVQSSDTP